MRFREWLITESKQSIVKMGYPEIIAQLLYEKFSKNAPLIARWYREDNRGSDNENWWNWTHTNFRIQSDLSTLTTLYQATKSEEDYVNAIKKLGLSTNRMPYDLEEERHYLKRLIDDRFFDDVFFHYTIIKDIQSGKLKDLAPYKKLSLREAQEKYDRKNIFQDKQPLRIYENGFKWIDVGRRCHFVANLMRNCGNVGLMSGDPKATLLVLFGPTNTPHVVVTYSPSQNRISSEQGAASTAVKPEYHDYVLDLVDFLEARFDVDSSKSKLLSMKYRLKNKATNLQIVSDDPYAEIFKFDMGGKTYYSNSYVVVSEDDIEKAKEIFEKKEISPRGEGQGLIKMVFINQPQLANLGVKYTLIQNI